MHLSSLQIFLTTLVTIYLLFLTFSHIHFAQQCSSFGWTTEQPYEVSKFKNLQEIFECLKELEQQRKTPRTNWPLPVSEYQVRCEEKEVYDLTVRPRLSDNHLHNEEVFKQQIQSLKKKFKINYDYKDSSQLLRYWLLMRNGTKQIDMEKMYDIYPQLIDLPSAVKNISEGLAINQAPINDEPMYFMETPKNVCHRDSEKIIDMLIIVKSVPTEFKGRERIRNFYSNVSKDMEDFTFKIVFNTALPYAETGKNIQMKYMNVSLSGRAGLSLEQYLTKSDELTIALLEEAKNKQDILIGGYYDTYYNLTTKTLTSIRWGSIFCRDKVKLFLLSDDDALFNLTAVSKIYKSFSKLQLENLAAGNLIDTMPAIRPKKDSRKNRYCIDFNEFPWRTLPPYLSGMGIFLGPKIMMKVGVGSIFVDKLRMEDAYLGMILYKLSIIPKLLPGITLKKFNELNFEEAFAGMI